MNFLLPHVLLLCLLADKSASLPAPTRAPTVPQGTTGPPLETSENPQNEDGGPLINIEEYNEINYNQGTGTKLRGLMHLLSGLIKESGIPLGDRVTRMFENIVNIFRNEPGPDRKNEGKREELIEKLIKEILENEQGGNERDGRRRGRNETERGLNRNETESGHGTNETEHTGDEQRPGRELQFKLLQLLIELSGKEKKPRPGPEFDLNLNNDGFDLSVQRRKPGDDYEKHEKRRDREFSREYKEDEEEEERSYREQGGRNDRRRLDREGRGGGGGGGGFDEWRFDSQWSSWQQEPRRSDPRRGYDDSQRFANNWEQWERNERSGRGETDGGSRGRDGGSRGKYSHEDDDEAVPGTGYTPFPDELREVPLQRFRDGVPYGQKSDGEDDDDFRRAPKPPHPMQGPLNGMAWYPNVYNSYIFYGSYSNVNNVNNNNVGLFPDDDGDDDDDDDKGYDDRGDKRERRQRRRENRERNNENNNVTTTAYPQSHANSTSPHTLLANTTSDPESSNTTSSPVYFCIGGCFPSIPDGFYRDCSECSSYYMCVNGNSPKKNCGKLDFNQVTDQCDMPLNVNCDNVVRLERTTTPPPTTIPPVRETTHRVPVTTGHPPVTGGNHGDDKYGGDEDDDDVVYCVDDCYGVPDGTYPSCKRCQQYTKCWWGAAWKKSCSWGHYFKPEFGRCMDAELVNCPRLEQRHKTGRYLE